jgi:hypothetical protein
MLSHLLDRRLGFAKRAAIDFAAYLSIQMICTPATAGMKLSPRVLWIPPESYAHRRPWRASKIRLRKVTMPIWRTVPIAEQFAP